MRAVITLHVLSRMARVTSVGKRFVSPLAGSMLEVFQGISVCDRAERVTDGFLPIHYLVPGLPASRRQGCMMSTYMFLVRINRAVL